MTHDIPPRPYGKIKDPEMHAHCLAVWKRWIRAEVDNKTTNEIEGYRWQSHAPPGALSAEPRRRS